MDISEAASLARTLMNQHGLGHVPFRFNRAKSALGITHFLRDRVTGEITVKDIALSEHFVKLLPEDEIRDVILHEIAHALTPGHGHDPLWKRKAREIGAKPNRCTAASARPEHSVKGVCPNGHESGMHRLPLRVKSCSKCSPKFSLDYAFVWSRDGKVIPISDMPERYRSEYRRIEVRNNSGITQLSDLFR